MPKALSSICLVLLICFGGSAWAGKPKIAVLGLEVAPGPNGAVDPDTTQVARDITKDLRSRAQSGASPYVVAPNSNKELTDEKLLMSCDNEAMSCMVVIGAGLLSDVLLYGRIERKGDVYRVSLKLLDVKAKTIQQANGELPVGGSVAGVAKKLFGKLAGDSSSITGTLVVKAKSQAGALDHGAVMVDEDRKGELVSGKLTVTGLTEGRHTVAIEASGYRRFEETVTIHGDEQASLDAVLIEKEAPPPSTSSKLLWKVSMGASIGVLAAGAGFAAYSFYIKVNGQLKTSVLNIESSDKNASIGSDDCGKQYDQILVNHPTVTSFNYGALQNACTWKTRTYIGYVIGGIGLLGTVGSLIMLTRDSAPSEGAPTAARGKQPDVAIVPVLTPDFGGASLSVRW